MAGRRRRRERLRRSRSLSRSRSRAATTRRSHPANRVVSPRVIGCGLPRHAVHMDHPDSFRRRTSRQFTEVQRLVLIAHQQLAAGKLLHCHLLAGKVQGRILRRDLQERYSTRGRREVVGAQEQHHDEVLLPSAQSGGTTSHGADQIRGRCSHRTSLNSRGGRGPMLVPHHPHKREVAEAKT